MEELDSTARLKTIFISFLRRHSKRHCSPDTHRWYRHYLKSFAKRYGSVRLCDLRPDDVEDWLERKDWSETTQNRAITCVKVALNWAVRRKLIRESPIRYLAKPPIARRERILTSEERRLILRSVKDQAFKLFLFAVSQTGARPGEVRRVSAEHFDPSGMWIFPPRAHKTGRKTGKPRIVYLTPAMTKLCTRLMNERPNGTPLFVNTRGEPWTPNAIRIRFRNLRERFPQLNGVVCYCWRHTWTTDTMERGVPSVVPSSP